MKITKQILPVPGLILCVLLLSPPITAQETGSAPTNREAAALTNTIASAVPSQATNNITTTRSAGSADWSRSQPIVQFGQDVELRAGDAAGAVVVIGGSAMIHGRVREAVVVIGGNLEVDGEVGQAAVAVLGNVHINPGAVIHQDAVAVLGTVSGAPGVKVGGNAVAIGGKLDLADAAGVKGDKVNVGFPPPFANLEWLGKWVKYCVLEFRPLAPQVGFVWVIAAVFFLIYLFIAAVFPRPVQVCVDDLNRRPATIFLVGLLTKLLVPFVYLILAVTGIGLIVAPIVWVALFLFAILGKVAILQWLGSRVGRLFGGGFQKPLLAFLVGTIIITLLYMVPVVGLLTYIVLGVWALGSGITAIFGRLRQEAPERPAPPPPPPAGAPGAASIPPIISASTTLTESGATPESSVAAGIATPPSQPSASAPPVSAEVASFPKAALWERLCAAGLDIVLIGIVSGIAHVRPYMLMVALIYFAGMWTWRGTTIGGIVLKLKVVRADGRPLTFMVALVRGLAAALSVAVFFLGFLWVAWDKDKQGWHDKIAGTEVIRLPHSTPLVVL